ncbi:MAG TPA: 3-isopropylmalate dehydratase large subunit [Sulfurihydrogenibium sp.]|uniref:3-isopropylmalate dehydratase large subunit n=1 Tax=Sulfurihydrogenibium sp. (strain YO3AOP1) TaxID=436114 RepID=LEUC_SULSY|nr:3-isopropylmalate dehydratase large subunit [Sulfurihydrogenibium sp. YO3AOP1]B2V844.1 RecName: Full=3-isopropylmalate dehydratase large subunit; AltName: Full=Alpha-IPM isomerase; Short=IPMI; AltName: Full=Isopropylmalate isomerase [Sulfurihydrogenibium sp. YO3AOP1]ACD66117.1 homoaconitate hydratase family protein [Sulfurihydrogenibium sp. YO3AOP1]HBT98423.1 3-isopropylmalate dehydratase large subunit [Sulfurihydrogenibium sp.]
MGMTITEKIIAAHAGRDYVEPGELVTVKVDLAIANDITAPLAIKQLEKYGIDKVHDPNKIALVMDHFFPPKDIMSAQQIKISRDFAKKMGIKNYFEGQDSGVMHTLLPEKGFVVPGDLVIGADSHTCTYGGIGAFSTGVGSTDIAYIWATGETWLRVPESMKFVFYNKPQKWVGGKDFVLTVIGKIGVDGALYKAMEYQGEAIRALDIDNRLTIANMAIEAGGKSGIIEPDEKTVDWVRKRTNREFKLYKSDPDAKYCCEYEFDASKIEPVVACPSLPSNVKPVSEVAGTHIDQVFIGSCTNGRLSDLRIAAAILKSKKVHPEVRCIVIPASDQIYKQALHEGIIEILADAGCLISTSTCGPCLGGHMGILAEGEVCLSTSNRNFVGRMGHPKSQVYLSSPAVAAASAVLGRIAHPDEVAKYEEVETLITL